MMDGFLRVRRHCPACGEALHHHRADDFPTWATLMVVGHVSVPALLVAETSIAPPLWVYFAVWPTATLALTLWLLPRLKGMAVAFEWAMRMHGFGAEDAAGDVRSAGQRPGRAP